jgi:signal transduction histidine kinase
LKKSAASRKTTGLIPNRVIVISVGVVCLGLIGSAILSFRTLSRLHVLYLSSRGTEIARTIETQARGGTRRRNPEFWQSLLEEKYADYTDVVAYLALVDGSGRTLASAGKYPSGQDEGDIPGDGDVFRFEQTLGGARSNRGEGNSLIAGWRIRIGLYSSEAEFIRRQAWILLAVDGSAIVLLVLISFYLIRMLNRFLELKTRESSEAHLKSLGIMAASLAHEIRNPLGSMKGLTQLAQEELPREHGTQSHLSTVVSEAERLERLVSDLLDFARPKEPQISEFNLIDLLADIHAMLQPRFAASNVAFEYDAVDGSMSLKSDAGGIRQVLLNVLMNALEATPAGGAVNLRILQDKGDGFITIQVDDTGEGLGGRDAEDLFEPFVTTGTRGTGLGLTISRKIIEGLKGTLTLTDNPDGGMRCTIRMLQAGGKP